ncbi:hypothetical protein BHE74_00012140, partial [Ensete ventricosum]
CSRAGNCLAEVRQAAEMAASGEFKNKSELRVFESTDELATDLAEYISQLSENSVSILNSHVFSINDHVTVEDAAGEYEFAIRQLVKIRTVGVSERNDCPRFDLILLGIGPDGHVASLFPHHPALELKEEWVTYITDSPKPPPERITFTLPVINSASNVAIVATGEEKAMAANLAIAGSNENSDFSALPARMVQPTDGKLVWFLDSAAASALEVSNGGSQNAM